MKKRLKGAKGMRELGKKPDKYTMQSKHKRRRQNKKKRLRQRYKRIKNAKSRITREKESTKARRNKN